MVTFDELPQGFFRIRGVEKVFFKQNDGCFISFGEYGYQVHFNFADNFQVAIYWPVSII